MRALQRARKHVSSCTTELEPLTGCADINATQPLEGD